MSTTCLSCPEPGPELATGVTGKECVLFADAEEKTLERENGFDVDGLSCPSEDGVPGMRRIVLSLSAVELFVLKLRCGSRFLKDDFALADKGLGGKPDLVELGLGDILVDEGNWFSNVLEGICKEDRLGRLE